MDLQPLFLVSPHKNIQIDLGKCAKSKYDCIKGDRDPSYVCAACQSPPRPLSQWYLHTSSPFSPSCPMPSQPQHPYPRLSHRPVTFLQKVMATTRVASSASRSQSSANMPAPFRAAPPLKRPKVPASGPRARAPTQRKC